MGYCWYLRRNDNRTLFDLGKDVAHWGAMLGAREPIVLYPAHQATLGAWLLLDILGQNWNLQHYPGGAEGYVVRVAKAIIDWCDGHYFEFCGEDDFDDWWDDPDWDKDLATTGTRFTPVRP